MYGLRMSRIESLQYGENDEVDDETRRPDYSKLYELT
jgi:hypothetical protein